MNQKRYWLKGILWFESVWFVLWIIYLIIGQTNITGFTFGPNLYSGGVNRESYYHDVIPAFLSISIIAVVSGALIGWLYGKIKNRFYK